VISVTPALLGGISAALVLPSGASTQARQAPRWSAIAALVLLPAYAFLSMFPATGGLAFGAVGTAVGLGAGLWLRKEGRSEPIVY